MDKGIEEATEAAAEGEPEAAAPEGEQAKPDADAKPEGETPDDSKPDDKPADVEAEIAGLQLKEKAANRFRELTGRVEELSTALKAAGIADIQELPEIVKRAKNGEDLIGMVMDTGATGEHFGQALEFLKLDAAAVNGDMKAAEQAYEVLQAQLAGYARMLGKDVPGIVDPLADHADLAAGVQAGDITRAYALEMVRTRNQGKLVEQNTSRQQEREGLTRKQQEAVEAGRADLNAWDADMKATDPTYIAKRAALDPLVAEIRATKPPQDWARLTALAYARIPTPQPAPAAKPPPSSIRGNRGSQGMVPDLRGMSMEQAFDIGAGL